jgi:hypothetical protein
LKKIFNLLLLCLIPISACVKNIEPEIEDSTVDCSILETYYTDHVAPILLANCINYGCHTSTNLSGQLDLSIYTSVKTRLPSILDLVNREQGSFGFMPMGKPKLSDANLDSLYSFSQMECDE